MGIAMNSVLIDQISFEAPANQVVTGVIQFDKQPAEGSIDSFACVGRIQMTRVVPTMRPQAGDLAPAGADWLPPSLLGYLATLSPAQREAHVQEIHHEMARAIQQMRRGVVRGGLDLSE